MLALKFKDETFQNIKQEKCVFIVSIVGLDGI